ncbi:MAG: radical SAM family heme chaperone HemW [Planctomycetes bacterium]|nr:radical SAM family heme chaperone HemW [Planctomycetota bacterium]
MSAAERSDRAPEGTPLYVHLPFCAAKCHYCDFFSVAGEGQDGPGMVAAILAEARLRAPRRPTTVFLGGGTPSYLSEAELRALLDGLQEVTDFRASATEVTAECNPESLTLEKARLMRALGVNRVSIGFQSLQPEVLELFGRVHGVDESFRAFEHARAAGFERVNVDLIYAHPGHSRASWERDLARVLALGSEHLAAYNLSFEEETPFERWMAEGKLHPLPEELELELFALTRELTARAGRPAYEISNYAKPGEACRHNVNYWRNGEYLGLGPSAASKVGFTRSGNVRSIALYRRAIERGETAAAWSETPSPALRLAETWWLGLRLVEGVEPALARRTAGWPEDAHDVFAERAAALAEEGWLERRANAFALSARGLPLADTLARRFFELVDDPAS